MPIQRYEIKTWGERDYDNRLITDITPSRRNKLISSLKAGSEVKLAIRAVNAFLYPHVERRRLRCG